jgi:hypothetical protein
MQEIFTDTGLIDLVVAVTLLEWAALSWLWRRRRTGLPPLALSLTLLPGLCLMLAVRSAMLGLPWYSVALLLSASGLIHLFDLRKRWTR